MSMSSDRFAHPPTGGNTRLPSEADVVIVGGGIIGLMTAWHLARAGERVVLLEKGRIAREQSGLNLGYCRSIGRKDPEIPLLRRSIELWSHLQKTIGHDLGFRNPGLIALAASRREEDDLAAWRDTARRRQHHVAQLDSDAIAARLPHLATRYQSALFASDEGWAEPQRAAPAIAQALLETSATIVENCPARALIMDKNAVRGVRTPRGAVHATRVLIAAGAWSTTLAERHGITLYQLSVRGSAARLADDAPRVTDIPIVSDAYYLRPCVGGGFAFGRAGTPIVPVTRNVLRWMPRFRAHIWQNRSRLKPQITAETWHSFTAPRTWPDDALAPFEGVTLRGAPVDHRTLARAHAAILRDFPALAETPIVETWSGTIDVTPDALPIIDALPDHLGLFLATGFSGHGFGIAPAAGELTADLLRGAAPGIDPAPFSMTRFNAKP
ncbi:MAG: FAD-binding oxidoreductase [Pseudomonadota bacterium]